MDQETIILSVGGSLISHDEGINIDFLKKLNTFIREQIKLNRRFLLVVGGGRTARNYRDAGKNVIGHLTNDDLDWIGIHSTRLNAHLVRTIFQDIAHPRIIENYQKGFLHWTEPIAIGAGWKPGWSTDYCAVLLAQKYHASVIINLSNIDWVYDRDPNKFKDAKKIKKTTWDFFETIVGTTWTPGTNAPFDPIASQLAKKLGLTVIITNGDNLHNIGNMLNGEAFQGTVITPFKIDSEFYDRDYYEGKKRHSLFPYRQPIFRKILTFCVNWYRALWIKTFLNPKTCLDVGFGTGDLVSNLRKLGVETYGIEVSEYALEIAPNIIKPYLKQGDIANIPYEDNTFDLVCSYNVLEHIERSKLKQAAEEVNRVSKKFIMHRIYTKENIGRKLISGRDYSQLSIMPFSFWQSMFQSMEEISYVKKFLFKLPIFFESLFVFKKK